VQEEARLLIKDYYSRAEQISYSRTSNARDSKDPIRGLSMQEEVMILPKDISPDDSKDFFQVILMQDSSEVVLFQRFQCR
jgi:hypothetical protein